MAYGIILSATQRQTNSAILYTLLIIYASVNFHAVRQLYREILSVADEYGGKLPNRVKVH